jgi:hypothetical protein
MGYITRFDGELRIHPPMVWAEVRDSRFGPERFDKEHLDVKIRVEEVTVETDEGFETRRTGVALVPAYEDEMRGYNIVEHVQQFLDSNAGVHDLEDRLDCRGEETGDLWRLEIHDGRAVQVRPRILWPDGTEEVVR